MLLREMEGWMKDATAGGVLSAICLVFCFGWLFFSFNFFKVVFVLQGFESFFFRFCFFF